MSVIYITGLSGSGKSTIAERLRNRGYEAHDADTDLCAWYNNTTGKEVAYPRNKVNRPTGWQEHHSFLMSEDKLSNLSKNTTTKTVFICGIAPNDLILAPKYFDKIFFLSLDEQTMIERVRTRQSNSYGHDSDQLAVIKKWYQPTKEKYLKYGVIQIDATIPIEEVIAKILIESE